MSKKILYISFAFLLIALFFFLPSSFFESIVVLNPKGTIGMKQKDLLINSTLLMLIVVIPVFILLFVFAIKYREGNKKSAYRPDWDFSHLAEALWWGIPLVIIAILGVITYTSSHDLNPYKPLVSEKKGMKIQAVALQWKWLFLYPEQGIATVNWVQFPEKTPITFEITADAPMNSFWIPQLGGQIYAMAAMKTQLNLIANEPGVFRGCSSNLSGDGFSGMNFTAKACSDDEFSSWASSVRSQGSPLGFDQYKELVPPTAYVPVSLYRLQDEELFEKIIMQYMGH